MDHIGGNEVPEHSIVEYDWPTSRSKSHMGQNAVEQEDCAGSHGVHGTEATARSADGTPEFILSSAELLMSLSEKGGRDNVDKLITLLRDDSFDMETFKSHIRSRKDCRRIVENNCNRALESDGFLRQVVRPADRDGNGKSVLYRKDIMEVLRKQIASVPSDEIIFRPSVSTDADAHPCHSRYTYALYDDIRRSVQCDDSTEVIWNDCNSGFPRSFVGFLKMFTDKTSTTLKSNALVAYPIHAVF